VLLYVLSLAMLMVGMDTTIVNVALPVIGHEFRGSVSNLQVPEERRDRFDRQPVTIDQAVRIPFITSSDQLPNPADRQFCEIPLSQRPYRHDKRDEL
jgi:hypothetical protein